ncbi:MAG: hypothetical protein R3Y54_11470 [Eubacteriales bacterium]
MKKVRKNFETDNLELEELYEVVKQEFDLLHHKHDQHVKRVYISIAVAFLCMFLILIMEWIELF